MVKTARIVTRCLFLTLVGIFPLTAIHPAFGQDTNASLSGTVMDPSNAVVPGAKLTLVNESSGFQSVDVSDSAGEYTFRNLTPGKYDLTVTATGFKLESQKAIELAVNQAAHLDIHMTLGQTNQSVEVTAEAPLINYETQTLEGGVSPEVLQDIPLVVTGGPRTSVSIATMLPGVTNGVGNQPYNARINGGLVTGDEAIVDGVTAEEGFMNQSGMVSLQTDFGMSPDITSEVHVLLANYDAQYGNTTSGQLIIQTKSGGEMFHGGGYDYIRNNFFNAIQYGEHPANGKAPPDKENDFGAYIGGPWYIPGFHGPNSKFKGYFYFNWEGFQDHGGAVSALLSIANPNDIAGNFSGWSTQLWYPNDPVKYGALAGTAIPGNMIDPAYEDTIAKAWLAALPTTTSSAELNNYYIPVSGENSLTNSENVYFARADLDIGSKDHLYYTYWWQYTGINYQTNLPVALSNADPASPENAPIQRFNWEHTLSSRMTNHFSFGYLNRNEGYFQLDRNSTLPKVSGVASTLDMPEMSFANYTQLGNQDPANSHSDVTTRGTYGLNDVFTTVFGRNTLKAGFEWKKLGTSIHNGQNEGGTFSFAQDTTGNTATGDPGDDLASFYLGAVGSASTSYYNVTAEYPRQYGYAAHFGDEWRVTPKFIANLSMRWDYISPFSEKFDNLSFFDPNGLNPGAVNLAGNELPGRLAYAGTKWGAASYGKPYPEIPFKRGWSPRVGFAYTLNEKTVVRAGYGIYYGQAFYSGWNGGMSQDGFNKTVKVAETPAGTFKDPALYLENGISAAQTGSTASDISSSFDNGIGAPNFRPLDGNRRPYSQQWSMTVERQLPSNFFLQVSYVGTKGTHLPSALSPLNVLNPLNPVVQALGTELGTDTFTANESTVDGISQPYVGWAAQMTSCAPTVEQAMVPYPMYCGVLQGQNEQHGTSIYNSFQGKVERHLSRGLYVLGTMTVAKLLSDSSPTTQSETISSTFSPFMEKPRAWALAPDNVPITAQITAVYNLPFGRGERWVNNSEVADETIGGWRVTPLFHYDYGSPNSFYSSNCVTLTDAPSLSEHCVPGVLPGQTVELYGRNGFNPSTGGHYFNPNAFEPSSAFSNFGYTGYGKAVESVYSPDYKDWDISLAKDFNIVKERVKFKFAANFFNAFNEHSLISTQSDTPSGTAFNTDVANGNFGQWNGSVSTPRTIQFAGRLEF